MRKSLQKIWQAIGDILQFRDILLLFIALGGGGGAVIMFLRELPFYYPLFAILFALAVIGYEVYSLSLGYKKWMYVIDIKESLVDELINLLMDMHLKLGNFRNLIANRRITKAKISKICLGILKILKIPVKQYALAVQSNKALDLMNKKVKKAYKLDTDDYTSSMEFMNDLGKLLNRQDCGLKQIKDDNDYSDMYKMLLHRKLELPINIRSERLDLIDRVHKLSEGLHNVSLFMIYSERSFRKDISDEDKSIKESWEDELDNIYTKALRQVKSKIFDTLIKGK